MTSKTATATIHLTELDLLDLIGQVSSEYLLDLDSLIQPRSAVPCKTPGTRRRRSNPEP
jgi:hypothetical protein